jgi:putative SOS response-associated peptidase YedK
MPAFLTKEGSDIWLDNELSVTERLKVIEPVGEGFLESVKINKVGDMGEFEHRFLSKEIKN